MKLFSEGLFISPPPCFQAGWFYYCFSKNPLNLRLGPIGTKCGESYRSPIFITALLISVSAWILLGAAMFTLSTTPALVTSMPFLKGSLSITNTTSHMVTHMNYYGGLNAFVVEDCSRHVGSPSCPPHVQDWPSVQCEVYFDNCDKCRDSTAALVMPTIMAFVTQALQILGDIQRSTVKGDFHFMKMIGIVTGIFGLVSTLVPMYTFADACLTELQPGFRYHNVTINSKLGTAFYLLLVATLLKVVDVLAHFLVPVPDKGYWEPSAAAGKANVTKEISLTELTEQKWEKCSVEVGVDASSEGTKTQPSYSKI